MSDLTPGDSVHEGREPARHESGLPGHEPARAPTPGPLGGRIWSGTDHGTTTPVAPAGRGEAAPLFAAAPVPGRYVLAGWWQRAGALLIDGFIVVVVACALLVLLWLVFAAGFIGNDTTDLADVIMWLTVAVVSLAIAGLFYAPTVMAMTDGRTLGRMVTGCRVMRADGRPLTFGFAVVREVLVKQLLFGVAGAMIFGLAPLLDCLWPLWDEQHRALHDMVVDTRVVRDR